MAVDINITPIIREVTIEVLKGGGIPEAPIDGTQYGRQDAGWTSIATGGGVAGADKEIQFNDGGVFGASSLLKWDETDKAILLGLIGKLKQYNTYVGLESQGENNIRLTTFGTATHVGVNHNNSAVSSIYLGTKESTDDAIIKLRGVNASTATDVLEYVDFLMSSGGLNIKTFKGKIVLESADNHTQINDKLGVGHSSNPVGIVDIRNGNFLFNHLNDDWDFVVDGTENNLIRTLGDTNKVGIGKSPTLAKLDVNGDIATTGVLTATGTGTKVFLDDGTLVEKAKLSPRRTLTNATVTGTQDLDYDLYESFIFTLTGNVTLTESNVYDKIFTMSVTGDFAITYPSGWSTFVSGVYDGTVQNTFTVWRISAGVYKVQISQPS